MKNLFRRLNRWLKSLDGRWDNQTTFVYCPECGEELCSMPGAYQGEDTEGVVVYICWYKTRFRFLFGPPVPILLDHSPMKELPPGFI